jgi:superfamily II DNA or RNA helicase
VSAAFLDPVALLGGGPRRFNLAIQRLLLHLGFDDVRIIDGAGDGGGDILAHRGAESFVFQCKWTTGATIGRDAVDEVEAARTRYGSQRAVVVTNATPDGAAQKRASALADVGSKTEFWTSLHLQRLAGAIPDRTPGGFGPRGYQTQAIEAIERDLGARRRALLSLATGLGKTAVGGEVIRRHLERSATATVLVVAAMKELVQQLELALWRHLPKAIPTQVLNGDQKPISLRGVTCATVESALKAVVEDGYRPDLIMVDETHRVAEEGAFSRLLELCSEANQFGVTATPWRGDGFDITTHFGQPCFKLGIAEGMAKGWLAQVDYQVLVDDVDWDVVRAASKRGYTLKELNSKLFLPQRDEAILDVIWETWSKTPNPRAILFCKTIPHAEEMAKAMARYAPNWANATCLHTDLGKRERDVALSSFRSGRIPVLTAVDILNEGVDVPDVNILAFLRVTHSRRIFVQQLGRGLRLREGVKERVTVLDFVTDVRRLVAILNFRNDLDKARSDQEILVLSSAARITFSNAEVGTLMDAWLRDVADVETAMDEAKLQFPALDGDR